MKNNHVKYRKIISQISKQTRYDSKQSNCCYCGSSCSSFCNSHSIPAFCLRTIAKNGEVYYSNIIIKMPILDTDKGINDSGTFHLLCNECDSKIFIDYENPDNYINKPTVKMLAQIAMKNYLKLIDKRVYEIALYENMRSDMGLCDNIHKQRQTINNLDLNEYLNGFNFAKKTSIKSYGEEYYLFYFEKLDYVVPFAFQGAITLIADFEGKIINDIYSLYEDKPTNELHICVLPMKSFSVVLLFINNEDKVYKSFYKQFRKLSDRQKLAAISYIIFLYSEDIFVSKTIDESIINNEKLVEVCRRSIDMTSIIPLSDPVKEAAKFFDIAKMDEIPNLLDIKYKIK